MKSEPPASVAEPSPIERWVDASALEGGDGSSALPFKRLGPALEPRGTVHLRSGLYEGPFVLPPGVRLVGHGEAVLFAQGDQIAVSATDASLEGLSVQGGFTGLSATGNLKLERVHFSGHRRVALASSGQLRAADCVFDGTVSETRGVVLTRGSSATLVRVRFTGAFRRAVDSEDAALQVDDLSSDGPVGALHLVRSQVSVKRLKVSGGRGPAIFTSEGVLVLNDAEVTGHEYALQVKKTALEVGNFVSRRAQQAGISTLQATGTLSALTIEDSGPSGGLQLLDSTLEVKGLTVTRGEATGVMVRHGKVTLAQLTIEKIRSERTGGTETDGDGLHVRDAEVTASQVTVRDVEGSGLFASVGARVKLQQLQCERCRVGTIVADLGSMVWVYGLISRGGDGPAIAVLDKASVMLEGADLRTREAPIWAECGQGAQVTARRTKTNLFQPPSVCVELTE